MLPAPSTQILPTPQRYLDTKQTLFCSYLLSQDIIKYYEMTNMNADNKDEYFLFKVIKNKNIN